MDSSNNIALSTTIRFSTSRKKYSNYVERSMRNSRDGQLSIYESNHYDTLQKWGRTFNVESDIGESTETRFCVYAFM